MIPITWNDTTNTLLIDTREGAFPGMPSTRAFRVAPDVGTGIEESDTAVEIRHDGRPLRVELPAPARATE